MAQDSLWEWPVTPSFPLGFCPQLPSSACPARVTPRLMSPAWQLEGRGGHGLLKMCRIWNQTLYKTSYVRAQTVFLTTWNIIQKSNEKKKKLTKQVQLYFCFFFSNASTHAHTLTHTVSTTKCLPLSSLSTIIPPHTHIFILTPTHVDTPTQTLQTALRN